MPAKPFVVPVPDLIHAPGARRRVSVSGPLDDARVSASALDAEADVVVDATLESVQEGVLASGTVRARWTGECRRCLVAVRGELAAAFRELFEEDPTEGESYPLRHEQIDLAPLAREVVVLELPGAPLCREDCAGLCPRCGVDLNEGPCDCGSDDRDPRWAALDALRPAGGQTEDN